MPLGLGTATMTATLRAQWSCSPLLPDQPRLPALGPRGQGSAEQQAAEKRGCAARAAGARTSVGPHPEEHRRGHIALLRRARKDGVAGSRARAAERRPSLSTPGHLYPSPSTGALSTEAGLTPTPQPPPSTHRLGRRIPASQKLTRAQVWTPMCELGDE